MSKPLCTIRQVNAGDHNTGPCYGHMRSPLYDVSQFSRLYISVLPTAFRCFSSSVSAHSGLHITLSSLCPSL